MSNTKIRVRFAPSPTGTLHVGNARTAVLNYVFAQKYGGTFVLRIEDTDQERSSQESTQGILNDLKWLGIDWDEGPEKGGDFGPYHQSERLDIYKKHIGKLVDQGKAYPCFCTAETLDAVREEQKRNKQRPGYTGTCRNLSQSEVAERIDQGQPFVYRYKIEQAEISFQDGVRGAVTMPTEMFGGDFVIQKSDGFPTYNFAVVVDDGLMQITHVLRGEDHLANTGKQLLLYKDLGFEAPQFFHMSMILGSDRSKLSKRHGSTTVREFQEKHLLPEALFNYLCLLGWNAGDDRELYTAHEVYEAFASERLNKSAAIFDPEKLRWINEKKFAEADEDLFVNTLRTILSENEVEIPWAEEALKQKLLQIRPLIKDPTSAIDIVSVLIRSQEADGVEEVQKFPSFSKIANFVLQELEENGLGDFNELKKGVQASTEAKGKELFQSLRVLLTGQVHGPDLSVLYPALDLETTKHKIMKYAQQGNES